MSYPYVTSESVCAGHPDKICDQISDAIVDAVLAQDPTARLGVETAAARDRLILFGEITTTARVDYDAIARHEIARLGYTDESLGFWHKSPVDVLIGHQSPEIAVGVDTQGAGDQGMMYGYACRETPQLMPLPITLAHELTRAIDNARRSNLPYLLPDGKAQVTIRYQDHTPIEVTQITIAVPHTRKIDLARVRTAIITSVVDPVLAAHGYDIPDRRVIVNGTGVWHTPGPMSDAGLTGRKIVVDGYGGVARVGGGAFSGKDPTKVDRSGAYAARHIAKHIVAAGLADRVEVALAYVIGQPQPVMQAVETFGTQKASAHHISEFAASILDTSVAGIIHHLRLNRPIYHQTAAYGHFGRPEFPWENLEISHKT